MRKSVQLLLVFLIFFLPAIDTDLGWHLRYGQYFFETGHILRENTLTYFLSDYAWPSSYSGYQILTFFIYKLDGLLGLSIAYGLLGTLAFWVFNKINPQLTKINLLLYLSILLFGWTVFPLGWRAQFFSFLGLTLLFLVLKRVGENRKWLFVLPIIFLIWANLHGGFVLGLVVLGLAVIQATITEIIWHQPKDTKGAKLNPPQGWKQVATLVHLGVVALVSSMSAFINPYGIDLYREVLRHAQYPLHALIAEWVAPNTETQILIVGVTAILLFSIVTSHNSAMQNNGKKVFWILVVTLFTILVLQARRNLPFFGLVTALVILELFHAKLIVLQQNTKFARLWPAFLGSAIIVLLLFQVPKTLAISTNLTEWCNAREIKMPCRAVAYIRAHPPDGENVFAAYEWGGFLEWQLPQYKYFVDGRMPAWPTSDTKSPYTYYLEIIQARPGYQEKLDGYGTAWLLIGAGTFLDLELQKNKNTPWHAQYRDTTVVVYTRN